MPTLAGAPAPSVLDLFSVGIGPSSSHTVGPMVAARRFATDVAAWSRCAEVTRLTVDLFGSLGATGVGHGTLDAVVAGLRGADPATCDPAAVTGSHEGLAGGARVGFDGLDVAMEPQDVRLRPLTKLARHPNALRLSALAADGTTLRQDTYYSVGGGFVVRDEGEEGAGGDGGALTPAAPPEVVGPGPGPGPGPGRGATPGPARGATPGPPWPFTTGVELLAQCQRSGSSIADVVRANEVAALGGGPAAAGALDDGLTRIWSAMRACVDAGLAAHGVLPGRLGVRRRAAAMRERLERDGSTAADPGPHGAASAPDWLAAFALAVNEENAAGGRVVTAPTNGAAGVIPAVLHHYVRTVPGAEPAGVATFLLTATAVGVLVKTNASISGAEAGCQGEVGTASAMAAAGFCAVLGGTPPQVENAAEIALEHHLGLTCDPVGGLVQIPCIERNAIAAGTAVGAARLALHGDGVHRVSLDTTIATMWQTGQDMSEKYKETSLGGLAVNVPEC